MKALLVSHNSMSPTSNMGKTMLSYFEALGTDEIAQFYIHSEVPTDDTRCRNYYRFTDQDAIRSLVPFQTYGRVFGESEICKDRISGRTDTGLVSAAYRMGTKRTASVYVLRNLLWKLSQWDTPRLWKWVEDFSPDVVFFASGDYGFMYDIARKIADHVGKPLVVVCVDDYYLHNRNGGSLLGRLEHRFFLKTVHKTMARASRIFTISESLKKAYEGHFGKPCYVLHTAASAGTVGDFVPVGGVSYLGNLGLQRNTVLTTMGRAMKKLGDWIDVYSGERNPQILKDLTEENGIRFHGAVSAEEVRRIMQQSLAVIHTESFETKYQAITRFSVSTKIADSLMYGPCIIAFGPEGIASIDYLKENQAAYVISDPEKLEEGLREVLSDEALRQRIVTNARRLAHQNHDPKTNPANVRRWLEEVCEEWARK